MRAGAMLHMRSSENGTGGSWFSPSTAWVLGIKLGRKFLSLLSRLASPVGKILNVYLTPPPAPPSRPISFHDSFKAVP